VTRVLIADDHPPTRAAIRRALEGGGFSVCGEAHDAKTAVELSAECHPEVALLDIDMPGNGIAAAGEINGSMPETVIVMLTVSRHDNDLFDALRAGAAGYLLKGIDPQRLPLALQGVLDGEAALPRALVAKLIDEFRDREDRRVRLRREHRVRLTAREWEVLEFMRQGLTTAQIARRLFVAPVTVRTYVSSILKKLQVPDREAAVRLYEGR
jgi:DNA-binding NarL/FixJ family response regulator